MAQEPHLGKREGKRRRGRAEGELGQGGLETLKTQPGRGQHKWKGPERRLKTEGTRREEGGDLEEPRNAPRAEGGAGFSEVG